MTTVSHQTILALHLWRKIVQRGVAEVGFDWSPRQVALLLEVYLEAPPHSVKSLAVSLALPKATICRALDTLGEAGLLRRKRDAADKRNVLVMRTIKGMVYLSEMAEIVRQEVRAQPLVAVTVDEEEREAL